MDESKTDDELKASQVTWANWVDWSAVVLLAGVVIEALPSRPDLNALRSAGPIMVAAGVVGEILFGRRERNVGATLQKRFERQVENERLARAKIEGRLAQRSVKDEPAGSLAQELAAFSLLPGGDTKQRASVFAIPREHESVVLLHDIAMHLRSAGWDVDGNEVTYQLPLAVAGVAILYGADNRHAWLASERLADGLRRRGVMANTCPVPIAGSATNISVWVGNRP